MHPVERYISHVLSNISDSKFPTTLPQQHNFSKPEKSALHSLRNNPNNLILAADKGNTTVCLEKDDYLAEANHQLSNSSTCQLLTSNPTQPYNQDLHHLISTAGLSQGLSKTDISLLLNSQPRTPSLCLLPKIHKPVNPGRPSVLSYDSPTESVSAYIDAPLQAFVKSLPSHIQDTNHFLNKIRSQPTSLPPDIIVATVDASSLYTNIPHTHGLLLWNISLINVHPHTLPSTQFLVKLTQFILIHNNFSFNSHHYLQIKGTAMGTRMAPSYANLFMDQLEQKLLNSEHYKPSLWLRFINNIFLLWPHGPESLFTFLEWLNSR